MDFTKVTRFLGNAYLNAKPHIPTGMVVLGIGAMAYGAIKACMQTAKELEPVLDQHEAELTIINDKWAEETYRKEKDPEGVPTYSEELKAQETMALWGNSIRNLIRVYWKPALIFAAGVASVGVGFGLEHAAKVAAVAYGSAVARDFKSYRGRVVADQGTEKDLEYLHGTKKEKVVETVTDPETGETKTVVKEVDVSDRDGLSMYSFIFDEGNSWFDVYNPRGNLLFLTRKQWDLTDKLRTKGWLTLNEALSDLGIAPVREGNRAGWLYRPNDPNHKGDNEVTITILDTDFKNAERMSNGEAPPTVIDLNCDGDIMAYIEEHKLWPSITAA